MRGNITIPSLIIKNNMINTTIHIIISLLLIILTIFILRNTKIEIWHSGENKLNLINEYNFKLNAWKILLILIIGIIPIINIISFILFILYYTAHNIFDPNYELNSTSYIMYLSPNNKLCIFIKKLKVLILK